MKNAVVLPILRAIGNSDFAADFSSTDTHVELKKSDGWEGRIRMRGVSCG